MMILVMQPRRQSRFAFCGYPAPMCILTIVVIAALKAAGRLKHSALILLAIPCAATTIAPYFSISLLIRKKPKYKKE